MSKTFVDLVTDGGELVHIECPDEHSDDLFESLENAMKTSAYWSPGQFDGCRASYMGMNLNCVAMKKVIGYLD